MRAITRGDDRMSRKERVSETPATAFLKKHGIAYSEHVYEYVEHGGTRVSAESLGVEEHAIVKTLVMEDERKNPLIVLMHGDRTVSTKNLARQAGFKRIEPCTPEVAQRHSGYQVGGTSPFGTRKPMPVYLEKTILDLDRIYINGGRRGYLVGIDPQALLRAVEPILVEVALIE
jgi:Cys-tRNA(Pro) deacylase